MIELCVWLLKLLQLTVLFYYEIEKWIRLKLEVAAYILQLILIYSF